MAKKLPSRGPNGRFLPRAKSPEWVAVAVALDRVPEYVAPPYVTPLRREVLPVVVAELAPVAPLRRAVEAPLARRVVRASVDRPAWRKNLWGNVLAGAALVFPCVAWGHHLGLW